MARPGDQVIRIVDSTNGRLVAALLDRAPRRDPALERRVAAIVERVRRDGDRAVSRFAARFDGLGGSVEVSPAEMDVAIESVPEETRRAIRLAARNIARVARRQVPSGWTMRPSPGVEIEQRVLPLERIGCYVPGGRYPLPSSLLMTAIPARVAGVNEIIAVCPKPDPSVMLAAREAGVTRLLRLGGAHAIAALAFGTATIPRVDKIVGPGNAYVAAAKALVSSHCAIDFFAGPSEILIVSATGRAAWIAADLLAQAEHDPDARALLVTPSRRLARAVATEVRRQMPASGPARAAIARNGGDHRDAKRRRGNRLEREDGARARRLRFRCAGVAPASGRNGVRWPIQRASLRRLCDRLQSRPADVRRRARAGRAHGSGLRARVYGAKIDRERAPPAGACGNISRDGGRAPRARRLHCRAREDETIMSGEYRKPTAGTGVRLHLNENSAGCSPRVHAVLQSLTARVAALYPDYDAAQRRRRTRVRRTGRSRAARPTASTKASSPQRSAALRDRESAGHTGSHWRRAGVRHVRSFATALGGRMVDGAARRPDFEFPGDALAAAHAADADRLRHQPAQSRPASTRAARRPCALARDIAPTLLFVDEAYADFTGRDTDRHRAAGGAAEPRRRTDVRESVRAGRPSRRRGHRRMPATLAPLRQVVPRTA